MNEPLLNEILAELRAIKVTLHAMAHGQEVTRAAQAGCMCPPGAEATCQGFNCSRKPPPRRAYGGVR